jgi:hypothetical protein
MSEPVSKQAWRLDLRMASGSGLPLGRGTGMTLREMRNRITEFMRRKKMPSRQWRNFEQKQELPPQLAAPAPAPKRPAKRPLHKMRVLTPDDLWSQL